MKFKGTWFLALFAIALGLYVYLIEFKKAAKDEEKKAAEEKIIDFDSAKVKTVTITNSKGEFILEKEGNDWKLIKPIADKADSSTINGVLTAVSSEKYDDAIDAQEADLKNFGLDKPNESITITTQDGVTKKMSVGTDAAIPGKIYLQRGDEKKALYANSGVKIQLDKALKEFRDKQILRKNKDDVTHFVMKINTKDNHGQASLTKKDGKWILDSQGELADQDTADGFLKNLAGLNATDFPSEKSGDKADQKKFGLNAPELDVLLQGKDNATLAHILVSKKDNNAIFVSVDGTPTIYQLFGSATDSLMKKPQDFRNKKIPLEFKKEDVADIYVKSTIGEIHLVKKGTSWDFYLADDTKNVSQIQVASFLDKMADLKVAEYIENGEKPVGLKPPLGQVVLKNAKDEVLLDFSWGDRAKVQRNNYASTTKYKGLFTVDASSIAGIPIQTLAEKKPTATPPSVASAKEPGNQSKVPSAKGTPGK
jgi:hypothetical protein